MQKYLFDNTLNTNLLVLTFDKLYSFDFSNTEPQDGSDGAETSGFIANFSSSLTS